MSGSDLPEISELTDDELLSALGRVLVEHEEAPPEVIASAKELFTWRTVDAELAALTFDSLVDDQPVLARAAAQPRILAFEADGLTIEVEVDADPTGRRLLGQLVPGQGADLEIESDVDPIAGRADELGRFAVPLPPRRSRIRIRVVTAEGSTVETAWFVA